MLGDIAQILNAFLAEIFFILWALLPFPYCDYARSVMSTHNNWPSSSCWEVIFLKTSKLTKHKKIKDEKQNNKEWKIGQWV